MTLCAGQPYKRLLTILFCVFLASTMLGVAGPVGMTPAAFAQEGEGGDAGAEPPETGIARA